MAKSVNPNQVADLYQTVMNDVINNIREAFLDDGVDEQVLQELRQTWESKVIQSKAVQSSTDLNRHGQPSTLPMYITNSFYADPSRSSDRITHQVVYQAIPGVAPQTLQMTAPGQQAALALPGNIIFQQPSQQETSSKGAQAYSSHQPGLNEPSGQRAVVLSSQNQPHGSDVGKQSQQPSVIIQVDGPPDNKTMSNDLLSINDSCLHHQAIGEQHITPHKKISQMDGNVDSSSSDDEVDEDDDDVEDEDDDDEDEDEEDAKERSEKIDEKPLCSDDDGSDEDPVELFDTENVVVCQYDKIHRTKSRWKFSLKVGIMNLNGKDFVFQKANGEADW